MTWGHCRFGRIILETVEKQPQLYLLIYAGILLAICNNKVKHIAPLCIYDTKVLTPLEAQLRSIKQAKKKQQQKDNCLLQVLCITLSQKFGLDEDELDMDARYKKN